MENLDRSILIFNFQVDIRKSIQDLLSTLSKSRLDESVNKPEHSFNSNLGLAAVRLRS